MGVPALRWPTPRFQPSIGRAMPRTPQSRSPDQSPATPVVDCLAAPLAPVSSPCNPYPAVVKLNSIPQVELSPSHQPSPMCPDPLPPPIIPPIPVLSPIIDWVTHSPPMPMP